MGNTNGGAIVLGVKETDHQLHEVSNTRLQELQMEHPAEITQVLQRLCLKGMLVSDNRRRWSCYRVPSSPYLASSSPHLASSSPQLESLILENLASPIANSKKAPKRAVRAIILKLCGIKHLSLEDLARLLNRDPKGLQNQYLTQMVSEGALELQFPEAPNHPNQAYLAGSKADLH